MTLSREEYINYRFRRAEESFDDAMLMIEKQRWNSAINRLYYACFYAVIALLLKKGHDIGTHDGARIKFSVRSSRKSRVKTLKILIPTPHKQFVLRTSLGWWRSFASLRMTAYLGQNQGNEAASFD